MMGLDQTQQNYILTRGRDEEKIDDLAITIERLEKQVSQKEVKVTVINEVEKKAIGEQYEKMEEMINAKVDALADKAFTPRGRGRGNQRGFNRTNRGRFTFRKPFIPPGTTGGMNPQGTKCHKCDSPYHFQNQCPQNNPRWNRGGRGRLPGGGTRNFARFSRGRGRGRKSVNTVDNDATSNQAAINTKVDEIVALNDYYDGL